MGLPWRSKTSKPETLRWRQNDDTQSVQRETAWVLCCPFLHTSAVPAISSPFVIVPPRTTKQQTPFDHALPHTGP